MGTRLYVNNFSTTLAANIASSGATSCTIMSAAGLSALTNGDYYIMTFEQGSTREIVKVTAVSGTTLTIVRGQEGTTATTWASGDTVELRDTAASYPSLDDNRNLITNNMNPGYETTGTSIGLKTLTVASPGFQNFTGSTNQDINLPVTSTLHLGFRFHIKSSASANNLVIRSSGSNNIVTIAAGQSAILTCVSTSGTTAASWTYEVIGGDVRGPASASDNALVRYDGTTGKLIQNSGALLDDNNNLVTNNLRPGYTSTVTAAGTTVLTVASTGKQFFTGTTTQTVTLPLTSTLSTGHTFHFKNRSTGSITVQSSGANSVQVITAGNSAIVTCVSVSGTTAADWSVEYIAPGSAVLSDGDYGDVTVSGSGTQLTVDLPALATVATDDKVYIFDTSAADAKKYVTAQEIRNLLPTGAALRPLVYARMTSTQAVTSATFTKIQFGTEIIDSNSNFDNTTNYRFTPTVAAKYVVIVSMVYETMTDQSVLIASIYKNNVAIGYNAAGASGTGQNGILISGVVDMNGSTDYVEGFAFQNSGSNKYLNTNTTITIFRAD